jgi:hypothetical protein
MDKKIKKEYKDIAEDIKKYFPIAFREINIFIEEEDNKCQKFDFVSLLFWIAIVVAILEIIFVCFFR